MAKPHWLKQFVTLCLNLMWRNFRNNATRYWDNTVVSFIQIFTVSAPAVRNWPSETRLFMHQWLLLAPMNWISKVVISRDFACYIHWKLKFYWKLKLYASSLKMAYSWHANAGRITATEWRVCPRDAWLAKQTHFWFKKFKWAAWFVGYVVLLVLCLKFFNFLNKECLCLASTSFSWVHSSFCCNNPTSVGISEVSHL